MWTKMRDLEAYLENGALELLRYTLSDWHIYEFKLAFMKFQFELAESVKMTNRHFRSSSITQTVDQIGYIMPGPIVSVAQFLDLVGFGFICN